MSKIVAIVGASGVGKTTLIQYTLDNCQNKIYKLMPITDREPRKGELDDIDKHFVTKASFDNLINRGEIREYKNLYGHRYGYLEEELSININSLCEIHYTSYLKFKKRYKNVVGVYIRPINIESAISAIYSRGATKDECMVRERNLIKEFNEMELMAGQGIFDNVFINSYREESKYAFASLIYKLF